MANPIPASYYPRRTDNSDMDDSSADGVIEHGQVNGQSAPSGGVSSAAPAPDGGDAGTKGTGSAG